MSETPGEAWESDDSVQRVVVMPAALAERLAAIAEQRGLSMSDLLVEYAEQGLRRDSSAATPAAGPQLGSNQAGGDSR